MDEQISAGFEQFLPALGIGGVILFGLKLWGRRFAEWVGGHFSRHEQLIQDALSDENAYEAHLMRMAESQAERERAWTEEARLCYAEMRMLREENQVLRDELERYRQGITVQAPNASGDFDAGDWIGD